MVVSDYGVFVSYLIQVSRVQELPGTRTYSIDQIGTPARHRKRLPPRQAMN